MSEEYRERPWFVRHVLLSAGSTVQLSDEWVQVYPTSGSGTVQLAPADGGPGDVLVAGPEPFFISGQQRYVVQTSCRLARARHRELLPSGAPVPPPPPPPPTPTPAEGVELIESYALPSLVEAGKWLLFQPGGGFVDISAGTWDPTVNPPPHGFHPAVASSGRVLQGSVFLSASASSQLEVYYVSADDLLLGNIANPRIISAAAATTQRVLLDIAWGSPASAPNNSIAGRSYACVAPAPYWTIAIQGPGAAAVTGLAGRASVWRRTPFV